MSLVDEEKLRAAVLAQTGIPVDVTIGGGAPMQQRPAPRRPDDALRATDPRPAAPAPGDDLETENLRPVSGTRERALPAHVAKPVPSRRTAPAQPVEILVPPGASLDAVDEADEDER
jgi:hypothetical protein